MISLGINYSQTHDSAACIARDGQIEKDIVITRSSPMFDQPAIDALRQWRFEPGRDRDGNPVRVMVEVPIRFQLR